MKIRDLIKFLQSIYDPNDSIIVAWWDQDSFSEASDMDKDEWAKAAEYITDGKDWSGTHDDLAEVVRYYIEQKRKNIIGQIRG